MPHTGLGALLHHSLVLLCSFQVFAFISLLLGLDTLTNFCQQRSFGIELLYNSYFEPCETFAIHLIPLQFGLNDSMVML